MPTPLEDAVQTVLKDNRFPAFSSQLQQLLGGDEGQSAQKLAAVVLDDFGLTVKVLQTANSFQYNRTARPIESVSHAIVVMGVRTVRNIASSLLFIDHFQKRSPALKSLMLLSMLSAHHAARAAEVIDFKGKEDAHLAGMFRNLGEVLVAAQFPEQYATILAQSDGGSNSHLACRAVLHYGYDELARAIALQWRLPAGLSDIWSSVPSGKKDQLGALAQFGHNVTTALYRAGSEDVETRMKLLLMQHGHGLGLDEETLTTVVEKALEDTQPIFGMLHMTVAALRAAQEAPKKVVAPAARQRRMLGRTARPSRPAPGHSGLAPGSNRTPR